MAYLNKTVIFKVDDEMYKWIKDSAHNSNISMAQVIRFVLDTFTKRNNSKPLNKLKNK